MHSGVPQGSVLGPFLLSIFINDLCDVVDHSSCLLFADGVKVCRAINSSCDCLVLQSDIDCVHDWCSENFMKFNFSKLRVIFYTRKMYVLKYQHRLENVLTLRTHCSNDLGVCIDCKLHFHYNIGSIFFTCNEITRGNS
jgi:hypothetical protein